MKMVKKITAVCAALAVAGVSAATVGIQASAANQIAEAYLIGTIGTNNSWNVASTTETDGGAQVVAIDGDAQYAVSWDLAEAAETGDSWFLSVVVSPTIGGETISDGAGGNVQFTNDCYPELSATLDAIYIDGEQVDFGDTTIDTMYYEKDPGVTRIYIHDDWAGTGSAAIGSTTIESNITVVFTLSGTGQTGTTNVTADTGTTSDSTSGSSNSSSSDDASSSASGDASSSASGDASSSASGDTSSSASSDSSSSSSGSSSSSSSGNSTTSETGDAGVTGVIVVAGIALAVGIGATIFKKRK